MNWNAPINSWWRSHVTLRTLYLLFLGQLVSFTLALMSFTSSLIADLVSFNDNGFSLRCTCLLGVDAPVTQSAFTYFSLALVYGGVLLYRRQRLRVAWYWYLLLGFVDVQGNFLVNKAYQFSSITSVTLLDCCTIAWAIVLTWLFLGTRYSLWQLLGAALCVLGLGSILELKSLESVEWSTNILLGFAGYAASSFMFYTLAPFVLKLSGATMFNLSLLTADMWAVVFRICFYHQKVDWLYFLAFGIVVIGLIIYSTTEKDLNPMPDLENRISELQYQILDNENVASTNEPSDS
ncbi:hypothetical protein CUMW_006020 [Citrus unshiu]|nr:hypothetical protein CUMW_006020 [Citrus unshiu]